MRCTQCGNTARGNCFSGVFGDMPVPSSIRFITIVPSRRGRARCSGSLMREWQRSQPLTTGNETLPWHSPQ